MVLAQLASTKSDLLLHSVIKKRCLEAFSNPRARYFDLPLLSGKFADARGPDDAVCARIVV